MLLLSVIAEVVEPPRTLAATRRSPCAGKNSVHEPGTDNAVLT